MSFSEEEKETVAIYNYMDDTWDVYSCVPKHITRLTKLNGEPDWKDETEGTNGMRIIAARWYSLKGHQVSFRSPEKKKVSEEQRKRAAENLKRARENS